MKGESAVMGGEPIGGRCCCSRLEGGKALADFAVLYASLHGEQRLRRVITQRGGKRDLFFGGKARGLNVGCAEFLQQLAREALDDGMPVRFRGLGDDRKRGPAQTVDAKKARAQRDAPFLAEG